MPTPKRGRNTPKESISSGKKEKLVKKENLKTIKKATKRSPNKVKTPPNPWGRMHEPRKAANLLITEKKEDNSIACTQFKMEGDERLYRPVKVEMLKRSENSLTKKDDSQTISVPQISPTTPPHIAYRNYKFIATTPDGTVMTSARSVEINDSSLLFLSPNRSPSKSDNTNKKRTPPKAQRRLLLDAKPPAVQEASENKENSATNSKEEISERKRKGGEYVLFLHKRDRKKLKSQRDVMGNNAEGILLDFIERNENHYNTEYVAFLKLLATSFKLELLHALAVSLAPKEFNPQTKANIGVAGKWINTLMMTLERLAAFFAAKYPGMVKVEPWFTMFPDSDEIIKTLHYKVTVQTVGKLCVVSNSVNVLDLPNRSNWPSTTDERQLETVVECTLEGISPIQTDVFLINESCSKSPKKC